MGKFLLLLEYLFSLVVVVVLVFTSTSRAVDDEYCSAVTRCPDVDGPTIRFPFRLKDHRRRKADDRCGYPSGFEVSCSGERWGIKVKTTVLEFHHRQDTSIKGLQLSYYVKTDVYSIDYANQRIYIRPFDLDDVSQVQVSSVPLNSPPFKIIKETCPKNYTFCYFLRKIDGFRSSGYTFFNCSSTSSSSQIRRHHGINYNFISSLSSSDFQVYALGSNWNTYEEPIVSCTKMFNISMNARSFPLYYYNISHGEYYSEVPWQLSWSTPNCGKCEAKGEYCKSADHNTTTTTCFPKPSPTTAPSGHAAKQRTVAGIISSIFLSLLVLISLYYFIRLYKRKKEDQLKIEMFLEDYKALKPTRYSYYDIKKITNQFKDKLGQGGYGSVYKGQLSNDIFVAVKVLNSDAKGNGEEFINEVGTIGRIHHVNVVRLVGYCADGSNRALVYEFLPNNSLEKFVYMGKNQKNKFLGWEKMQDIAIGIAKGIEYLHQGCTQRILHFDIKPHNILLDQNFNPKISDFGLAKLCSKGLSVVSMTAARGTIGYIAPEVFSKNFGKVSSKSDVYSFGMLLLEMVGGKNNIVDGAQNNNDSEIYFPEWIFHRLEQGGEVVIDIEEEVDTTIVRKLTIVGLWCIAWHPIDRPSMKLVIQMLEGESCPAMPPNPFSSTSTATTTHARSYINERLEVISESE